MIVAPFIALAVALASTAFGTTCVLDGSFEGASVAGPGHFDYTTCPRINLAANGQIRTNDTTIALALGAKIKINDGRHITLPPGSKISIHDPSVITFIDDAVYQPNCTTSGPDPFYASTTVFVYVVATTCTISWMLLILLLINQSDSRADRTPKTTGWLQSYGVPNAIAGRTPLGGLGNRPWLQKAAVFLVTIGLTVAAVDTFDNAEQQHNSGWNSARGMRDAVVHSYEIRVLRIVSTVFVWLALVQTLIRLFPRRKEKLIIKWFGFVLILLDTVFSCLNVFWADDKRKPLTGFSQDAISALAYLFQLSINLLYAAWVSYYVATQRRFAFFRSDQMNMTIVAMLALVSMAIPIGFFIADISVPRASAWGDFFRWVGGAAASVVVWEWVERIEALERAEKRDGILGREVFDEDEYPTVNNSSNDSGSPGSGGDVTRASKPLPSRSTLLGSMAQRFGWRSDQPPQRRRAQISSTGYGADVEKQPQQQIRPTNRLGNKVPFPGTDFDSSSHAESSPSRLDTTSPGSTVYAVHYHVVQSTPPVPDVGNPRGNINNDGSNVHDDTQRRRNTDAREVDQAELSRPDEARQTQPAKQAAKSRYGWTLASNAFKRRKRSPPLEIKKAMQRSGISVGHLRATPPRLHFKPKFYGLGSARRDSRHQESNDSQQVERRAQQPTVIPAPPRGQTWSPDILRHSPVHLLSNTARNLTPTSHAHPALPHRTPLEQMEEHGGTVAQQNSEVLGERRFSRNAVSNVPPTPGPHDGYTSRRQSRREAGPNDVAEHHETDVALSSPPDDQRFGEQPRPRPPSNGPGHDPG